MANTALLNIRMSSHNVLPGSYLTWCPASREDVHGSHRTGMSMNYMCSQQPPSSVPSVLVARRAPCQVVHWLPCVIGYAWIWSALHACAKQCRAYLVVARNGLADVQRRGAGRAGCGAWRAALQHTLHHASSVRGSRYRHHQDMSGRVTADRPWSLTSAAADHHRPRCCTSIRQPHCLVHSR